jgi:serine-threonine kinase receptor-associated protein
MLRNGVTGDWLGTFVGHKGAVWSAHINSTAEKVVTGSADYTAKIWDALNGEEIHSFNHARIIKTVNFSQDNNHILTGGQDKALRIFDLSKPEAEPLIMEGHSQPIKTALWVDQNTIISGAQDSTFKVWDTRTLSEVKTQVLKNSVSSVEASLDRKHITITSGREVSFWDISKFELVKNYGLTVELNSATLSPDASTFVIGGTDFWVRVYDFATGKELECHKGHHGPVHCVRFAPDGSTFASGSEDGTIRLWQSGDARCYGLWQEYKEKDNSAPKMEIAAQ